MTNTNCLDCGKELTDTYCSGCGQKADTQRITFKNFIFHDVLHGTFHIERGILFTAKQALVRPGKAALDYIAGKRKRYYNVFYLILITIGLMLFFRHIDELIFGKASEVISDTNMSEASVKINSIFSTKLFIFLFVPFGALNSCILFRKKKLNLSEHAIIAGMILLGILLLGTLVNIIFPLINFIGFNATIASWIITFIITFYVGYGYYNAFGNDYSKLGSVVRILLFFVLLFLEVMITVYILFGFVTNWKMGSITLAPFG